MIMEQPFIPNQQPNAPQENSFASTDLPNPEEVRKFLVRKRLFYVLLAMIIIVIGLLIWEVIDLAI